MSASSSSRAAASVLTILLAGCASPGTAPSVAPSVGSSAAPVAESALPSAATSAPSPAVAPCPPDQQLKPGTYSVPPSQSEVPVPLTITVTEGWKGCGLSFKELGEPEGLMMVGFWDVRNVYTNPCQWRDSLSAPPVGPTVDDLAGALTAQDLTEATEATDTALDGFSGKYVRLEVPADLDTALCDRDQIAEFRFWNGPGESVWWLGAVDAPGLIGEAWIVDIDGIRVAVQAASFSDAQESRRDEIHRIVESIDFQP
jgi:hypothetical protein